MQGTENSEAKKAILSAIRQNLATSAPFDALHHEHHAPQKEDAAVLARETSVADPLPVAATDLTKAALGQSFLENLTLIGGYCTIAKDKTEAIEQIKKIIEKSSAKKIALSDSPAIDGIKSSLEKDAEILQKAAAQDLFGCDLGITSAQWGIAETGTLVLESEKEFSRLTSLVPPVHICLLDAGNIRRTLGETLQILNAGGRESLSRTITFITGPSRTSDIELTLAIGVHGPRELHVIIVE